MEEQTTTTTQEEEQETTTTTTMEQEEETTTTSCNSLTISFSTSEHEALPDNSENVIHQLFSELGCNLDYTPTSGFQCFTMGLQFAAALWFIWWFVKFLFSILRELFSNKG